MKVTTITTSRGFLPVVVRYTCPECGKAVEETRFVPHAAQSAASGYQATSAMAQSAMIASAEERLKKSIRGLQEGSALLLTKANVESNTMVNLVADTPDVNSVPIFICPYCKTRQVNEAILKKHTLRPKSAVSMLFGMIGLITVVWVILLSTSKTEQQAGAYSGICAGVGIGLIILWYYIDKRLNQKALQSPDLMKKRYHAAVNNAIEVDFSEYDLGVVRVGSSEDTSSAGVPIA